MPLDRSKLKKIYNTLLDGGYEQSYEEFERAFEGNNYANRKKVYDLLMDNGGTAENLGGSYEEFMSRLYFKDGKSPGSRVTLDKKAPAPKKATPKAVAKQPATEDKTTKLLDSVQSTLNENRRVQNRMDYAMGKTGLKTPETNLGWKGKSTLGFGGNVVETKRRNYVTGGEEKVYLTESGNEYGSRAMADVEQSQLDEARFMRENKRAYLMREKERIEREMNQRRGEVKRAEEEKYKKIWDGPLKYLSSMPRGGGVGFNPSADNLGVWGDKKYKTLNAQLKQVEDALATLDEAEAGKKSDAWIADSSNAWERNAKKLAGFGGGAWRGLAHSVGKIGTWDFGITDMETNKSVLDAANAVDKGTEATKEDQELLDLVAYKNMVEKESEPYLGYGYTAGSITGESLPFMLEMAINPASGVGKGAMKASMRGMLKKYGKEKLKSNFKKYLLAKAGARVAGDVAGAHAMALTTGQGRVIADTMRRLTGDVQYGVNDNGQIVYSGRKVDVDGLAEAYLKSFESQAIENHSEMLGEYFAPLLTRAGKAIGKPIGKGLEKLRLGGVNRFIEDVGASKTAKLIDDFSKKTQWNGSIGEYAEEVAGGIENAMIVGDQTLDTDEQTGVFNLEKNIETFLGVGLMGGFMFGAKLASYRGPKRGALQEMEAAGNRVDRALGGKMQARAQWGEWRSKLLLGNAEEKKNTLREIMDNEKLPIQFRNAVADFSRAAQKYEGLCRAEQSKRLEGTADPVGSSLDDAADAGYELNDPQEMTRTRLALENERERMAAYLGVEVDQVDATVGENLFDYVDNLRNQGVTGEELNRVMDYARARSRYEGMQMRLEDDTNTRIDNVHTNMARYAHRENGTVQTGAVKTKDGSRPVWIVSGNLVFEGEGKNRSVNPMKSDESIFVIDAKTGQVEMHPATDFVSLGEPVSAEEVNAYYESSVREQMKKTFEANTHAELSEEKPAEDGELAPANETEGAAVEPAEGNATEPAKPAYEIGDVVTLETEEGPVSVEVQAVTADGVEVRTDEPWRGQVVQVIPTEEFEGMMKKPVVEAGVSVEESSAAESNHYTEGSPERVEAGDNLIVTDEEGNDRSLKVVRRVSMRPSEKGGLEPQEDANGKIVELVDDATGETVRMWDSELAERTKGYMRPQQGVMPSPKSTEGEGVEQAESAQPKRNEIPVDEKTGEPVYEAADPGAAWDALVEEAEGDEELAMEAVNSMVRDMEEKVKKAKNAKLRAGATAHEKMEAQKERKRRIAEAEERLEAWKRIAGVKAERAAAAESPAVESPVSESSVSESPVAESPATVETPAAEEATPVQEGAQTPVQEGARGGVQVPHADSAGQEATQDSVTGAAPVAEQTGTTPKGVEAIPTRKNNKGEEEVLYHKVPVARTMADLYDGGMDQEEIDGFVEANSAEAAREVKRIEGKKPKMTTNKAKYMEAKRAWQAELDEAREKEAYWKEVGKEVKRVTHRDEAPVSAEGRGHEAALGEDMPKDEPMDVYEVVASALGRGRIKITPESFRAETGYSVNDQKKYPGMVASAENGGVSVERAAEMLMEDADMAGFPSDDYTIRQAIIEVLQDGHPAGYISRRREEARRRAAERDEREREEYYQDRYGMNADDGMAYEETAVPNALNQYGGVSEDELAAQSAEAAEAERMKREEDEQGNRAEDGGQQMAGKEEGAGNEAASEVEEMPAAHEPAVDSSMPKTSFTQDEAAEFVDKMEARAESVPEMELTIENWDSLFGEDGRVETPIGEVKMGENQFAKLMRQGRNGKLGMIKPTLESPDIIIEQASMAKEGDVTERPSSYLFIKAFTKPDGGRFYYFTSVSVSRDGKEVIISNQEKSRNKILRLMTEESVIWRTPNDAATSSAEKQGLDYAHPNNAEDETKGSGITPQSTSSAGKVTESKETEQVGARVKAEGEEAEVSKDETPKEYKYRRNSDIDTLPDGYLRLGKDERGFDVAFYDHPLSRKEVERFHMGPITESNELVGKVYEVTRGLVTITYRVVGAEDGFVLFTENGSFDYRTLPYYKFMDWVVAKGKEVGTEVKASGKAREARAKDGTQPVSESEAGLRDALVDVARAAGVEVVTDSKEGQRVLDEVNGKARLSAKQKRALETASLGNDPRSLTVVSSATGAKVLNNLDALAASLENSATQPKIFLGQVANALGASNKGSSSQYATFETKNGAVVTIRLANHNASTKRMDNAGRNNAISIVVSPKPNEGVLDDGNAHVVEFYYDSIKLRKADGHPLAEIVRSIQQALYSGEYKDTTGLAERQEVNTTFENLREHRVFHGSGAEFEEFDHSHMGEGEGAQAYGWGTYVTEVEGIGRAYARNPWQMKINELESNISRAKEKLPFMPPSATKTELENNIKEWEEELAKLENGNKHLYTVEIPEDNGENYLHWEKPLTREQLSSVAEALKADGWSEAEGNHPTFTKNDNKIVLNERAAGSDVYAELEEAMGSQQKASEFLSSIGFTGISYPAQFRSGGREDNSRNFVIFNEKDAQITDHVRFFKTENGEAYGFTVGGKVYLDPKIATTETAVHELTHLWADMLRKENPKEWKHVVELMKGTPVWDEVKAKYPELKTEDEIADEVLAHYSGRRGAERLRAEQQRLAREEGVSMLDRASAVAAIERVKDALNSFWKKVADLLGIHFKSAEEVADAALADILNGRVKLTAAEGMKEDRKELVAVHNITKDKLKQAMELGGFPMPSIAITKAGVGHTSFGDISLVFDKESINPTDKRNKVYGEDAWTPVFPGVGYKLNDKKTAEIYRRANNVAREKDLPFYNPAMFHPDNLINKVGANGVTDLVEYFKNSYDAKQMYLAEMGNAVTEYVKREEEKYSPKHIRLYEKMLEAIGLERLQNESLEELRDEIKRLYKEYGDVDIDQKPQRVERAYLDGAKRKAVDYALHGNRNVVDDVFATQREIDGRIDQQQFEEWLGEMFSGIVEKKGVRNDKDAYTPSGNARKWEQLYDEITLDNVVAAMQKQAAKGGEGLFGRNIFGSAQAEYKSIDEIRKAAKERIRTINEEEYQTQRSAITDRLSAIEIPGSGSGFWGSMEMEQHIHDAVSKSHTAKGIHKYLKKFYPGITMETAEEIADIVQDIQHMSARYFEAKPYRAVGFDEVKLAVVPSDMDAALKERLEQMGIEVRTYASGDQAQRKRVVDEATEELRIRFQLVGEKGEKNMVSPLEMSEEEKHERGVQLVNAPAVDVASGQIVKTDKLSARKAAEQWWGEHVSSPLHYQTEIGEVVIDDNSIGNSLAHRYGQAKLDAITSLEEGFVNAVYLGSMKDFSRDGNVFNHYFAYPINYDGKRNYVFCRALNDANGNRLYVHEVFVADKIEKGNTLQTAASQPHGGIALYKDILANVLDAAKVAQSFDKTNVDVSLLDVDGKPIVVKAEDGSVELNYNTWQAEKEQVREALEDGGLDPEAVDAIMSQAEVVAEAVKAMGNTYPMFGAFQNKEAGKQPILRNTGEYLSWDYSFNCVKKDALNAVIEMMVSEGKGAHLGITQMEALKKVLQKHGFLTPCVMCYVEAKRKVYKQSKEASDKWNAVAEAAGLPVEKIGKKRELTAGQEQILTELAGGKGLERVENFTTKDGEGIKADTIKKTAKLMLLSPELRGRMEYTDMMSPSSFSALYNQLAHTGLMEFLTQGQSRGKSLLNAVPFSLNSIPRELFDEMYNPVKLAKIGGLRQFSYEDARATMFFDYYQQFMLMQGARALEHLYTKRPFMPEMFGRTGAMMNQSLIVDIFKGADWHREALGMDAKVYDEWLREHAGFVPAGALPKTDSRYREGGMELVPYYSVESFPVDIAMQNIHNPAYRSCVGNTIVAPSVKFIQWALDNPNIHMILAYHAAGANPVMKSLTGYDLATGMDDGYHTKKDGKSIDNLYVPEIGLEIVGKALQWNLLLRKHKDARKAAQAYLDYCKEHGLTPMFCYEGVVDMSGDKAVSHPNYYKLLTDFRVYDDNGNPVRQRGVKMELPENWQEILGRYLQQEQQSGDAIEKIALSDELKQEIEDVTRYASMEPGERSTFTSLLTDIYGKDNVTVCDTETFDKMLDESSDGVKADTLRNRNGIVYGFATGEKIVLNEDLFNAHTPMHEHTHIYMKVLQATNPKLYARGMELWRDTPLWNDARRGLEMLGETPTDEKVFSECVAQFTGAENEKIISEVTGITDKNWLKKALSWIQEMWEGVKSSFSRWTGKDLEGLTAEQFAAMPVRAIYDAKERNVYKEKLEQYKQAVEALGGDAAGVEGHVSLGEDLEAVNERFNEQLSRYGRGMMDANEVFHLGRPHGVMQLFLPNIPIVMRQRVITKGTAKKHEVDVQAIINMPQHLSNPVFVFQRSKDILGVLTDMRDRNGKNVCVAIELKRQIQKGGDYFEVNDIRSFHGREFKNIVEPIVKNDTLRWVDKAKGLAYLSSASQPVQQEIDKQDLDSAAKVVEEFENPNVQGQETDDASYREVEQGELLDELRKASKEGRTVRVYRTMQVIDGKLYSPMAKKVAGQETSEIKFRWEAAEEHPELARRGDGSKAMPNEDSFYITIDKGQGKGALTVAYNPYTHTSRTVLNDQFSSAFVRPNLVVVEVEVPESELEGLYKAEKAKDSVGEMSWHSGAVSGKLAELGNPRKVILSRYDRPVRILTKKEEAELIAKQLEGTGIAMPYNLVTPQVREELEKLGVKIDEKPSGSVSKNASFGKAEYVTDEQIEAMNGRLQANAVSSPEAMTEAARALSEQLGVPVEIVTDVDSITHPNEAVEVKRRGAKGWYDKRTGKVAIVVPNHLDVEDVAATVFHEVVAHRGLRELVGEQGYDEFLMEVFNHSKADVRERMMALAGKHGWDIPKAVDEYLGGLAERGFDDFSEAERGMWTWLKEKVLEAIDKFIGTLKLPKSVKLGDNELRYLLWRSHENLRAGREGMVKRAMDVAKRYELGLLENEAGERMIAGLETYRSAENRGNTRALPIRERAKAVAHLKPVLVERNEMSKEELRQIYNALPDAVKDGRSISFFHSAFKKNYKEGGLFAQVLPKLNEILKGSVFAYSEKDNRGGEVRPDGTVHKYHPNANAFDNYVGKVEIDGKEYYVRITVQEQQGQVGTHSFFVTSVDVYEKPVNGLSVPNFPSGESDHQRVVDAKLRQFFDEARREDKASEEEDLYRTAYHEAAARDAYERRVKSGLYQSREALQDSMLGLRTAMEEVLKAEGSGYSGRVEDIPGFENAYLGENRLSSVNQAEVDEFGRRLFKPLLEIAASFGSSKEARQALTDYMMAKHGLERNALMRERAKKKAMEELDGDKLQKKLNSIEKRDFAGLTALTGEKKVADAEQAARKMVADFEQASGQNGAPNRIAELWKTVRGVTGATLKKMKDSGLITKEQFDEISGMYDFYIPLRGFDGQTAEDVYDYLGHGGNGSAFTSPIKKAEGRKSKADDPFAYMAAMAESAIMQGNRNVLVKQKFLNFVLNHPSDLVSVSDLWLRYDAAAGEWRVAQSGDIAGTEKLEEGDSPEEVERKMAVFEERMQAEAEAHPKEYKRQKEHPEIPYRVVEKQDLREHQVIVKRNGRDYVLTINGSPRAAQALNGLTNPNLDVSGVAGTLMNGVRNTTNYLSQVYTTRNPNFVGSNWARDAIYSNIMAGLKEDGEYGLEFSKAWLEANPVSMSILYSLYEQGELDMNNEKQRLFAEFMANGGETGYMSFRQIEERKNEIERQLKLYGGKMSLKKGWSDAWNLVDYANRVVENQSRFAAYMASRRSGRTIDRSIYDAKEITVNFNKKGAGSTFYNAKNQTLAGKVAGGVSGIGRFGFAFWNAAIQGTTNFARFVKRNPKKGVAFSLATMALGYVVPLLASIFHDDDDDKEGSGYFDLPDAVRRDNFVFRFPGMDSWITIPLPVEYRALYGLGELTATAMYRASIGMPMTAGEIAGQAMGQISQLMPLDLSEGGGMDFTWGASGNFNALAPSAVKPVAEAWTNKSWTGLPVYKDTPYNKQDPEWTKAFKNTNTFLVKMCKQLNEWTGGDSVKGGAVDLNPAVMEHLLKGYLGGYMQTANQIGKLTGVFGERDNDFRNWPVVSRFLQEGDERTKWRSVTERYFNLKKEAEETDRQLKRYKRLTELGDDHQADIDELVKTDAYKRMEVYDFFENDIRKIQDVLKRNDLSEEEREQVEGELNEMRLELLKAVDELGNLTGLGTGRLGAVTGDLFAE